MFLMFFKLRLADVTFIFSPARRVVDGGSLLIETRLRVIREKKLVRLSGGQRADLNGIFLGMDRRKEFAALGRPPEPLPIKLIYSC